MPPRRVAPSLQLFSARELGNQVIRILVRIETEIVATNRSFGDLMHLDNGFNIVPTTCTESIAKSEAKYAQLVKYLEAIPGALMDKIFRATIDVYNSCINCMISRAYPLNNCTQRFFHSFLSWYSTAFGYKSHYIRYKEGSCFKGECQSKIMITFIVIC